MKKKIKTKKFKNLKEFLETCSEDEQEYIYDLYNNASVADLIDLLFEHLPADDTIKEIEEYREELEWDDAEAERLNSEKV
jgi:lipoate-protein ligase A